MGAPSAPPEQFQETIRQMTEALEARTSLELLSCMGRILGEGDLIMLSSLGVDGRQKMLDVFIEQCQKLKKEIEDGIL